MCPLTTLTEVPQHPPQNHLRLLRLHFRLLRLHLRLPRLHPRLPRPRLHPLMTAFRERVDRLARTHPLTWSAKLHAVSVVTGGGVNQSQFCSFTHFVLALTCWLRIDVIVQLDACFTQKRCKGQSSEADAARKHTESVFLSESGLKAMEVHVESIRGSQPSRSAPATADVEDRCDHGMRVPNSVLDSCNDSFIAADEKREKASTKFFSDTGLMALLCRHDRVLFVANMQSAGEKQHYALSLLQELFNHIPDEMTVGLLYDIACQLERSCKKWGFLKEYQDRLSFAISVFHAYGHQWPCQVVYHPRKCKGFGLTDGEGCERFWSSIKKLIPSLRVSGVRLLRSNDCPPALTLLCQYHQRLITLDEQIKHLADQGLFRMGRWLKTKWQNCMAKRREAEEGMAKIKAKTGDDRQTFAREWKAQVAEQTKPAPRTCSINTRIDYNLPFTFTGRSRNKGKQAAEAILDLQKLVASLVAEEEATELKVVAYTLGSQGPSLLDLHASLASLRRRRERLQDHVDRQLRSLDLSAQHDLQQLKNSAYLRLRVNAKALKMRIRQRLCERKFELERLDHSYRNAAKGQFLQRCKMI